MSDAQAPSKDQVSYLLAKLCWHTCTCQNATAPSVQHGVHCVYEQTRASMPTPEPKSDYCELCTKPLPPVGAWSMPTCPDCQDTLEFLGRLQAGYVEMDQTHKADAIGNAITLMCRRTASPPVPEYTLIGVKHRSDDGRTEYIWWDTPPEGTSIYACLRPTKGGEQP
jgi:hypothetical protein